MSPIVLLPVDRPSNPAAYESAVLADNPTLFFKMDDAGLPLFDEQGCDTTTTTQSGTLTYQDAGKFGDAITSASAGAYLRSNHPGVGGCHNPDGSSLSWEAIIKRSGPPTLSDEYFFSYRINGSWGVEQNTGNLKFRFVRATGGGPIYQVTSPFNVCDGAWHHVVCTVNVSGITWNLYVDGNQHTDSGTTHQMNTSSFGNWHWFTTADNFTVPTQTPGTIESFNGSMSAFLFWKSVELSPAQVAAHYAGYQAI